jgi:hypothetical protein
MFWDWSLLSLERKCFSRNSPQRQGMAPKARKAWTASPPLPVHTAFPYAQLHIAVIGAQHGPDKNEARVVSVILHRNVWKPGRSLEGAAKWQRRSA